LKEIQLTQGFVALVDDEDYDRVSEHKWRILRGRRTIYAMTTMKVDGKYTNVYMHRFVLELTDPEIQGDHADLDGLNNQRHNLRKCTQSQNAANSESRTGSSSQYKGVSVFRDKWAADIRINNKTIHLGIFSTEHGAAMAYDRKAIELFGEFARTNFDINEDIPPDKRPAASGYMGVWQFPGEEKYRAAFVSSGRTYHVGIFPNAISAARAYDIKKLSVLGPEAKTNFKINA